MARQGSLWRRAALVTGLITCCPAPALAAEPVFEKYKVPSVGGAEINVEVMRPAGDRVPVILTYSPYNTLNEGSGQNLADDAIGQRYLERGYGRAVADVLGTRGSSGCWDYGGRNEQQSGVDVVNALAAKGWSNGRVGMIGGSYDGTTATMTAVRGRAVPALKAIVPIVGISRWYGYAYGDGVRYLGNSEVPSDEGFDTPLAFDFGFARTPPSDPTDPKLLDKLQDRANPCQSAEHTIKGYDRTPDYDDFWTERDYRRHANRIRAAVLVASGWQDYNVKQEEGVDLYRALPRKRLLKRLYMFQGSHGSPDADNWQPLLDRFFARTLLGRRNGIEREPAVLSEGRSATKASTGFASARSWPPAGTRSQTLYLNGDGSLGQRAQRATEHGYTDLGLTTEERPGGAGPDRLLYQSAPLTAARRLAGSAILDVQLALDRDHTHLTPVLADVAPDGTVKTISRGFLNLLYRDGLARAKPLRPGVPSRARVRFKPQDQLIEKGHRLAVLVQSSNTVWAVPDDPGATVTLAEGPASRLIVPFAPR